MAIALCLWTPAIDMLAIDRRRQLLLRIADEMCRRRGEMSPCTLSDTQAEVLNAAERWLTRRLSLGIGLIAAATLLAIHSILSGWIWISSLRHGSGFNADEALGEWGAILGFALAPQALGALVLILYGLFLLYRPDQTGDLLLHLVRIKVQSEPIDRVGHASGSSSIDLYSGR
jgi:hypothetical protein